MSGNSKAASLAARLVEPNSKHDNELDDDDPIFAQLEEEIANDDDLVVREKGLKILKEELERAKKMQENSHGRYTEIMDEKELIRLSSREPRCVIHFYHSKFKRCEIMDKHLAKLAPKHYKTRFIRVFVENIPWLVEKLGIKILPCVICFIDGVSRDRVVGFEELGNADGFDTAILELRLLQSGVISKNNESCLQNLFKVASVKNPEDDELFDL